MRMIVLDAAQLENLDLKNVSHIDMESLGLYHETCQQNAEPTGRLLPDGDDRVEYASQLRFQVEDGDGDVSDAVSRVIYFVARSEVETREDLSDLHWTPDHYEIVY